MNNPIEAVTKAMAGCVTILIVIGVLMMFAGQKPKPCPSHICYPPERIVTVEQMMKDDPDRFDPSKKAERAASEFARHKADAAKQGKK